MEIYALLMAFLLLLYLFTYIVKMERIFIYTSFIVLLVLSGIRYGIGSDYFTYYNIFYEITSDTLWLEPLYGYLNIILRENGFEFQMLIFICSFFTYYLIFNTIVKFSTNKSLSIILFVYMGFYFASYNILRQFLAMGICMYGYQYFLTKKYGKWLMTQIIASLFHYSSILLIPFYLIAKIEKKKYIIYTWILSMLLIFCNLGDYLSMLIETIPYYSSYANSEYLKTNMLFKLKIFFPNIIMAIILTRWNQIKEDKTMSIMVNMYVYFVIAFNVFNGIAAVMRVLVYLEIYSIIIVPYIMSYFPKNSRLLLTTIIIVYFAAMTCISVLFLGQYQVVPYNYNFSFF